MNNKSASLKPYRMGTSGNNEHRLKFRFALNLQPSAKMQMSHLHLICYGANIWQIFQAMSVERYSMTSMIFKWIVPEKIHPPTEEIINTPSLSLDILYKFKTFFRQFSSPYGGNFLCGWSMDFFWNDPRENVCVLSWWWNLCKYLHHSKFVGIMVHKLCANLIFHPVELVKEILEDVFLNIGYDSSIILVFTCTSNWNGFTVWHIRWKWTICIYACVRGVLARSCICLLCRCFNDIPGELENLRLIWGLKPYSSEDENCICPASLVRSHELWTVAWRSSVHQYIRYINFLKLEFIWYSFWWIFLPNQQS